MWFGWALLVLFAILIGAGVWAWSQRYSLMENHAVKVLAEAGFEAELDIVSVNKTAARIRDIRLRRDGRDVLRADEVRADYVWPDVRDGILRRVEMDGATAWLTLGQDWRPSDAWLAELLASGNGSSDIASFPVDGVEIKDGTLIATSPLGEVTLYADAQVQAAEVFDAQITLAPSDIAYTGFAAKGAGFATVSRNGGQMTIEGQTQTERLANDHISVEDAHLRFDGVFDLETRQYDGIVELDGQNLDSEPFASDAAKISWSGMTVLSDVPRATGRWIVEATRARTPNADRANALAGTLSLAPALGVVPVTEHFAPVLKQTVREILVGSDVAGAGQLDYGSDGFTLSPEGPLTIISAQNRLTLSPREATTFYQFEATDKTIRGRMDATFQRPVGLTLTDIDLRAGSEDGIRLDGITHFAATLSTSQNWRATDAQGQPVRLGPLSSRAVYRANEPTRRLTIEGGVDYDGVLPGGRVEGLTLNGQLDVALEDSRQVLDFTPRGGQRITLDQLDTPTGWIARDVSFDLPPTRGIFIRRADKSVLKANLGAADFTLVRPAEDTTPEQILDLTAATLKLNGQLLPREVQLWTAEATQIDYASETLPGPGTQAQMVEAKLTAKLDGVKPPQLTFMTPSLKASTPTAEVSNMQVELIGTPEDYVVDHTGGTVEIIGSDMAARAKEAGFASFPATGQITYANGGFAGEATLRVAKANDAPMGVNYTYREGAGTAEIDVPSLIFAPQGLQPQALLPNLRGKIARVTGEARARFNIAFADGALTQSGGTMDLIGMDIGTAPGPVEGLDATLNFTSLYPLETDGLQQLTLDRFNPGILLEDGVVSFGFVPDGVRVESARWPIGNGAFSLDPFTWAYTAEENRVVMRVEDVALGDFLEEVGNEKLEATGTVVGVFPIVVRGVQVLVEDGELSVPDGGVIRYEKDRPVLPGAEEELVELLRNGTPNGKVEAMREALREFHYRRLNAGVNGPLDGEVNLGLEFDGSNPKLLNSQPFRFNINVQGELFNIARSFNSNAQIKSELLRQKLNAEE